MRVSKNTLLLLASIGDNYALEAFIGMDSLEYVYYFGERCLLPMNGFFVLTKKRA